MIDLIKESFDQGLIPGIIVISYVFVKKIIDSNNEKKQLINSKDVTDAIHNIDGFVKTITKDVIESDREKQKNSIKDSFSASCNRILQFSIKTIIINNVEVNKENIISNIKNVVKSEFYTCYNVLNNYTNGKIKLSSVMKIDWMREVELSIIDVVYNNQLDKENKILSVMNRVNYLFDTYITYTINNSN